MAEIVARLDDFASLASAPGGPDDGRKDGSQRDGRVQGGFWQPLCGSLRRDDRAQDVHRIDRWIGGLECASRSIGEVAPRGHLLFQRIELCLRGELAVPQQICDLLEGHDCSKVFDEVSAPVDEPAVGAVNLADLGLGGDDPFEPGAEVRHEA